MPKHLLKSFYMGRKKNKISVSSSIAENYFSYYKNHDPFIFVTFAALIFKIMEFRLGGKSCL